MRDNTAAIINATGEPGDLWYERHEGDPTRLLCLKLAEEVGEYLVDGGWGELRDVLAVIDALAYAKHGRTLAQLVEALEADPRGGFKESVVMYGRHAEYDR